MSGKAPERIYAFNTRAFSGWRESTGIIREDETPYILASKADEWKRQRDEALDLLRRVVEGDDALVGPDRVPHPVWLKSVRDLYQTALSYKAGSPNA